MRNISVEMQNTKDLEKTYQKALSNPSFAKLVKSLKVSNNELVKNTSKLEETVCELNNCSKCKGLFECQNRLNGHVYFPDCYLEKLKFDYAPCKFQKKMIQDMDNKVSEDKIIAEANFKDIDKEDKNRVEAIKWIKDFYDKYTKSSTQKGLFLHGSFGSGKTYLISALFNELKSKKSATAKIVYFPEALRTLKDDWDFFGAKLNEYQTVDLLLIDDIGAEKVTEWGRDEVLGTILQYRMNNKLPTFLTSNLNIDELKAHLAISSNKTDNVKAIRIIERIKQLTDDIEMISENRRK